MGQGRLPPAWWRLPQQCCPLHRWRWGRRWTWLHRACPLLLSLWAIATTDPAHALSGAGVDAACGPAVEGAAQAWRGGRLPGGCCGQPVTTGLASKPRWARAEQRMGRGQWARPARSSSQVDCPSCERPALLRLSHAWPTTCWLPCPGQRVGQGRWRSCPQREEQAAACADGCQEGRATGADQPC